MAIKMDGHTITSLKLTASDGSTTTKALTEDGVITTPTATKDITENGTNIDVLNFSKVNVNVPTSGGAGIRTASGTFTITDTTASNTGSFSVQHNLNTNKCIIIVKRVTNGAEVLAEKPTKINAVYFGMWNMIAPPSFDVSAFNSGAKNPVYITGSEGGKNNDSVVGFYATVPPTQIEPQIANISSRTFPNANSWGIYNPSFLIGNYEWTVIAFD